jgi:hypothetical protein
MEIAQARYSCVIERIYISILSFILAPDVCTCATGWNGSVCQNGKYFDAY